MSEQLKPCKREAFAWRMEFEQTLKSSSHYPTPQEADAMYNGWLLHKIHTRPTQDVKPNVLDSKEVRNDEQFIENSAPHGGY